MRCEAEKKFPESKEKHEDELSGEKFLVDINEGERLAYISGREEGIEEMLKFVKWAGNNAVRNGVDQWTTGSGLQTKHYNSTGQLYLEYKKL